MSMIIESTTWGWGMGLSSTPILAALLVVSAVLYAIHYYQMQSRLRKLGDKIPGPPTVPFLGNALMALGKSPHGEWKFIIRLLSFLNRTLMIKNIVITLEVFFHDLTADRQCKPM